MLPEENLQELLEAVLNSLDEGIHVVNEKGNTVIYNRKMAELENMDRDYVLNKNLLDVFPSLDEETSTLLQVLREEKVIENKQQEYLNKSGQKVTTINTTLPIKIGSGRVWALEIAKDITEIKDLYNKIIRLQEKLFTENETVPLNDRYYRFDDIIGEDKKLRQVINYGKQAARTDSSILIVGDTGTGKELIAQSIHNRSRRGDKPFIAQNCAALPENLLEGILFGTRKGGFTGAVDRKGLFEQASGGTLLLDEINSMSPALQAKLLRVLQEGIVRPVGSKKDVKVDVRIIATINTSPVTAIKKGSLREDLYYRLAVVLLYLPPLADRGQDILLLARHFIEKFNRKFDCQVQGLSEELKQLFLDYSWPGNVRQLEHVVEGAMNIIDQEQIITKEHVEPFLLDNEDRKREKSFSMEKWSSLPRKLDEIEKNIIRQTLKETNGNVTEAARRLGIKRQSLQYRLNKHNIERTKKGNAGENDNSS